MINNAIKFTENGSISCTCSSEDNFIKFIISDTGVGINKERLHSIFDRFVQADLSLSRGYEGSGLGLSIVKAYVEMLKGEIWVESEEGVGSTFFLKIPYEKSQKDTPTDINHKEENTIGSSLKILVAEDDDVSIELIKSFFDKDNHRITFAHTGREVLDKFIHDNDFDLILMDLKMPVMDGITAIREIRKIDKTIPIIAQTAFAFPSDKTEAKEAGCNDYISKPILKEELLNKINAVLGI